MNIDQIEAAATIAARQMGSANLLQWKPEWDRLLAKTAGELADVAGMCAGKARSDAVTQIIAQAKAKVNKPYIPPCMAKTPEKASLSAVA